MRVIFWLGGLFWLGLMAGCCPPTQVREAYCDKDYCYVPSVQVPVLKGPANSPNGGRGGDMASGGPGRAQVKQTALYLQNNSSRSIQLKTMELKPGRSLDLARAEYLDSLLGSQQEFSNMLSKNGLSLRDKGMVWVIEDLKSKSTGWW